MRWDRWNDMAIERLTHSIYSIAHFGFPWAMPPPEGAHPTMTELRRIARRQLGRQYGPILRHLANALAALLWPFGAAHLLYRCYRQHGPLIAAKTAFNPLHCYWAAMRDNISPIEYVAHDLHLPDRWRQRGNYLYSNEWAYVRHVFNVSHPNDAVSDKLAFYKHCREHGLPTIPVFATVDGSGEVEIIDPKAWAAAETLFVKPRGANAGLGATTMERRRGSADMQNVLKNYGIEHGGGIAQPLLRNSPLWQETAGFVPQELALITIRLVTGLSENRNVIPLFAELHIPLGNAVISQHGTTTTIELDTGNSWLDGQRIAVPKWQEIRSLATQAHSCLPDYATLGWDLAIAVEGVLIVETNAGWDPKFAQIASGQPIDSSTIERIFDHRLKH